MLKRNLKSILILGGFGLFAVVNSLIIGGFVGVSLDSYNVFGYGGGSGSATTGTVTISSGSVNVILQTGTVITVSGSTIPVSSFPTPVYTTTIPSGFSESNSTVQGVVDLTFAGGAQFSSPVRIDIPVPSASSVYIKANHGAGFTLAGLTTDPNATCSAGLATPAYAGGVIAVVGGYATIYTCSASTFAAYSVSAGGGGGGGSSTPKDSCPNGDNSPSYYDGICGTETVEEIVSEGEVESDLLTDNEFSEEFNQAYTFAKEKGITSMETIQDADMEGKLLRSHMAKMMVNYAINVLGKTVDTSKTCNFSDMNNQSDEMKQYATQACQLGLMGIDTDSFMPNGVVTRAQFGTVLSRMLFSTPESGSPYYLVHLNLLKEKGIITNTDPNLLEMRAYVMIMLMRAAQ